MDKERLNELLDSIYELEGLVHLALTRDDSPERLPELIVKKGEELARHAVTVAEATAPSSKDFSGKAEAATSKEDITAEVAPVLDMQQEPMEEQPLYVVDKGDMEADFALGSSPIEEDMQSVVETVFDALPSNEPRGKLVFSINDRYRFKRELFNNSDADFNNTLALVASMEDYDEAEDYFLGELQWDPKRVEVVDFLEVLKRYFKG